MMQRIEIRKALLGEGLASCDVCGHAAPTEEFITFYFGEHGEHEDLCRNCLDRDGWGRAFLLRQGERPSRRGRVVV
jgi:hypothetical protein